MTSHLRPPLGPDDHLLGRRDAAVTLVEYGDYQCPFCGHAHSVVRSLVQRLGERLCFAFRHFPITASHSHAQLAAEAAEAAGAQGRFWPMHDHLFANQQALAPAQLVRYAADLGLDLAAFEDDLRSHRFLPKVHADQRSGALSGVNGTPTFFIDGLRHDGDYDFDSLWSAIAGAAGVEIEGP
jgi:protein-disulfide isomerase